MYMNRWEVSRFFHKTVLGLVSWICCYDDIYSVEHVICRQCQIFHWLFLFSSHTTNKHQNKHPLCVCCHLLFILPCFLSEGPKTLHRTMQLDLNTHWVILHTSHSLFFFCFHSHLFLPFVHSRLPSPHLLFYVSSFDSFSFSCFPLCLLILKKAYLYQLLLFRSFHFSCMEWYDHYW